VTIKGSEIIAKLQFKLDNRCSKIQAEQLAILKALEKLEVLNRQNINPLSTIIFTDSRISLDSLQNYSNHGFLVEEIRKNFASLERSGWQIMFPWVKTHIRVHGNEMTDKVAKEAKRSTTTRYEYTRIPKSYLYHVAAKEAKQKWQAEWITSYKAAATKQYFPSVRDRLGTKLTLTTKLAAVLTGHQKTRAYLYRFNLRDDVKCTCGQNDQPMDHLLFHCEKTSTQRKVLKHQISQQRNWMEIKQELKSKHTKVSVNL